MERLILKPQPPIPDGVPRLIHCSLNPDDIQITRDASLVPRAAPLFGSDGPSLGYGREAITILTLNLLVVGREEPSRGDRPPIVHDVRERTQPLYRLAERGGPKVDQPCLVDFVWGKDWAFRGAIARLAERLDAFTGQGVATRSWMRLEVQGRPIPRPGAPADLMAGANV